MMDLYELVEKGKKRQGIESDRGFALANNINPQAIVDLKSGKSNPNAFNYLQLIRAAGLSVDEGIAILEAKKQAGYASLEIMLSVAGVSLAGLSLLAVTSPNGALIGAALGGAIPHVIHMRS